MEKRRRIEKVSFYGISHLKLTDGNRRKAIYGNFPQVKALYGLYMRKKRNWGSFGSLKDNGYVFEPNLEAACKEPKLHFFDSSYSYVF